MIRRQQLRFTLLPVFLSCVLSIASMVSNLNALQQEDVLLKALKDELTRSMEKLQLKDMEKPYYIEYAVTDVEMLEIKAAFGSIIKSERDRSRLLRVEVRIGNYDMDNSQFVSQSLMFSILPSTRQLVIEDDYLALRRDLWLATDRAYKQALEQLAQKRAFIKTKIQAEKIPDFSREKAITAINPEKQITFDQKKLEEGLRRLSALFRKFPAIYDSSVSLHVKTAHKYFINSEGTVIRQPAPLIALHIRASTQASDGSILKHFIPFYGTSLDQLPPEKDVSAEVWKMAEELTALTSAPVLENYLGPVLLTEQAAGELFSQVLAPHFSGERPPLLEQQQLAAMMPGSKLARRLNRRVLPSFLTVTDDPTQKAYGKQPLIGFYRIDDQGVSAQPVRLIEKGVLKKLLMSRRPRKEILQSNGHARAMEIGAPGAQIGNLFVKNTEGKSLAELKQELLDLCRDQGLSFGLLIKKLDNPNISGSGLSLSPFSMGGGPQQEGLTTPILIYKVFVEDGREEMVRGVNVGEMSVTMLKDIVAAGKDYYVNNKLSGGSGVMGAFFSYASLFGDAGATGIPTSVVAPSVLLEEIELIKPTGLQRKPAILKHPFFKK